MKFLRAASLLIALTLAAVACGDDSATVDGGQTGDGDTTRFYVGAEVVECEGVAPQECLQVSETGHSDYELFYDSIDGFQHVPGTRYVIDVEVTEVPDPPADGSSLAYRLVEIVEEETP